MVTRRTLADLDGDERHATVFDDPRTVRLALSAGESVPPHSHPEAVVLLHVLDGSLDATIGGDPYAFRAGELVRFDGFEEIALTATVDTTAIVVLTPRP